MTNNQVVAPLFVTADCFPGQEVPAAQPWSGTPGVLTCSYRAALPTNGIAAGFYKWNKVMARVTLGHSSARCSSRPQGIGGWGGALARDVLNPWGSKQVQGGRAMGAQGPAPGSGPVTTLGASNPNGGRRLRQLGFVPQGCQGLLVNVQARRDGMGTTVRGAVELLNPNTFDIPVQAVRVELGNNVPVAPMFVVADCPEDRVRWSPITNQYGRMTCTFSFDLPTDSNGAASNPAAWNTVGATATIGASGAKCASNVARVSGPLLMGH